LTLKRCLLVVGITLFLLVSSVSAQEAAAIWFWAWQPETGSVVAYTADGQTNVLLESGLDAQNFNGWRIDDESALAVLTLEPDTRTLYRLTADELLPVTFADPEQSLGDGAWGLIARSGQYVALALVGRYPSGSAVVVNLETNRAAILPEEILFTPRQSGFSEDGRTFRYLGRDPQNEKTWTIREYKLDTNTERAVYAIEDEFLPIISTSTHGDQWLYQHDGITTSIDISGETVEILDGVRTSRQIFGDHLLSFPLACIEDCDLWWESLVDGQTLTFTFSMGVDGFPNPITQVDDTHLLVSAGEGLWLLGTDGSTQQLGLWLPQTVVTPLDQVLSPDQRYLLVLDGADTSDYHVWDLQLNESVLTGDPERDYNILQIFYTGAGFIVAENTRYFQFYRYNDGRIFDLGEAGGIFFDSTGDSALLYAHYRDSEERPRGIYRYDLENGEYLSLVQGALPLYVQTIRREI
jgi:hypothetical protein